MVLGKNQVRASLCGREMASEANTLKREGGAYPKSGGDSTLMQRERGAKRNKSRIKENKGSGGRKKENRGPGGW